MAPSRACSFAYRLIRSSTPISTISRSFTGVRSVQRHARWRASDRDCSPILGVSGARNALSYSSRRALRPYSTAPALEDPPDYLDENEREIFQQLRDALDPVALQVQDVSGGCGTMFAVAITSEKFKGLPVIKQHRLVNQILGEKIKSWHGLQLTTKVP